MDSVIARVWKESCIYGRAYFYVYSHDSEIYVTDTLPLDTFVIYDNTVAHKPLYAVCYGHIGSANYKLTVFLSITNGSLILVGIQVISVPGQLIHLG